MCFLGQQSQIDRLDGKEGLIMELGRTLCLSSHESCKPAGHPPSVPDQVQDRASGLVQAPDLAMLVWRATSFKAAR